MYFTWLRVTLCVIITLSHSKGSTVFCNLVCGSYVTKINAVLRHTARQSFVSLGLFTWLVYAHTYCVPIATLNQNKRTRLLYLDDAQIKREALILHANEMKCTHYRGWLSMRISWLGKNQVSVVRINKCLWAFSRYQKLSETSMERSIEWRMCSIWHKFHSFMRSSPKFKMVAQISPCLNSLELPVIPCENS